MKSESKIELKKEAERKASLTPEQRAEEERVEREREILIREEVSDNFHPNDWRVYVIEDKAGYFCGFTNKGAPGDVPMFCVSLDGAEKFDAFRDLCAREKAVAIRNRYVPNAKVWAYKRHEIFPEQYMKGGAS